MDTLELEKIGGKGHDFQQDVSSIRLNKVSICYVDDSRTSAYVVNKMLRELEFEVTYFKEAEPALSALSANHFDLLITDFMVSADGMDGDELIRRLRSSADSKLQKIPIIVITGTSDPNAIQRIKDSGADDILFKPVKKEILESLISDLVPCNDKRDKIDSDISLNEVSFSNPEFTAPISQVVLAEDDQAALAKVLMESHDYSGPAVDDISSDDLFNAKEQELLRELLLAEDVDAPEAIVDFPEGVSLTKDEKTLPDGEEVHDFGEGGIDQAILDALKEYDDKDDYSTTDTESVGKVDDNALRVNDEDVEINIDGDILLAKDGGKASESVDSVSDINSIPIEEKTDLVDLLNRLKTDDQQELQNFRLYGMKKRTRPSLAALLQNDKLKLVGGGLGVLLLVAIFVAFLGKGGVPVDVVAVKRGPLHEVITLPGKVISKMEVDIKPALAGQLTVVSIKDGERVKKGQVLASLDDAEFKSQINRAQANLTSARGEVVLAERSLERLRRAYDMGAVSRQVLDDAQAVLEAAKARASVTSEDLKAARLNIDKISIVAPFDGTITARSAQVGQWVSVGDKLFTIVDHTQREVILKVDAADSSDVTAGLSVMLSSDAYPGQAWRESVITVAPEANREDGSNTVDVHVSLSDSAPALKFGQQVDAEIYTATSPNALKLPYAALQARDGKTWVATIKNDKVRYIPVITGIESMSHVEIVQGVQTGQEVILLSGLNLKDGDRVHKRD